MGLNKLPKFILAVPQSLLNWNIYEIQWQIGGMFLVYFKNLWKVAGPILHPFLVFFSNLLITWNFQNKTYILTHFFNRNKPLKFDRQLDFGSRSFSFSIKSNFAYNVESWIPRLSGLLWLIYLSFNRWVLNLAKWQLLYASLSSCCHFAKFKAVLFSVQIAA